MRIALAVATPVAVAVAADEVATVSEPIAYVTLIPVQCSMYNRKKKHNYFP